MQYISDPRDVQGNDDSMDTRKLRLRKANVEYRAAAAKSTGEYRKQQTLQVDTLRNIRVREEPFVDCVVKYWLE